MSTTEHDVIRQVHAEVASEIRDIARRCGVARRVESIKDELDALANKYQVWTDRRETD